MNFNSIDSLNKQIEVDFATIRCGLTQCHRDQQILDVAIIGGGQAGSSIAFALKKLGITSVKIFEDQPAGKEGPWNTYAKMSTLRTYKRLPGPSLDFPNLSFQVWYITQFGEKSWEELLQIPTKMWGDYIFWFREKLEVKVSQQTTVSSIDPDETLLKLVYMKDDKYDSEICRKVILATGRKGFGGPEIPFFLQEFPKKFWSHSSELIDYSFLKYKRVAVIGGGASAFDTAATALENFASQVNMLVRGKEISTKNPSASLISISTLEGYQKLSDKEKIQILSSSLKTGNSVPEASLERLKGYSNFSISVECSIQDIKIMDEKILLQTSKSTKIFDYIITATGFAVDVKKVKELKNFAHNLKLWSDEGVSCEKTKNFPYLGPNQAFTEKVPGLTPALNNIYCYNNGAHVSFPHYNGDIPTLGLGSHRLAKNIVADLFMDEKESQLRNLQLPGEESYDIADFGFEIT